jgi:hypothetical protein
MLGLEYWSALRHTFEFKLCGDTPEEIFALLRAALEEAEDGDWQAPWNLGVDDSYLSVLDLEEIVERGFVWIEDSSSLIADRLTAEARWDRERPWLGQWADGLRRYPNDVEMRARALLNLPDSRIVDPDGPLGCVWLGDGWWRFFGFSRINDEDFIESYLDDDDAFG